MIACIERFVALRRKRSLCSGRRFGGSGSHGASRGKVRSVLLRPAWVGSGSVLPGRVHLGQVVSFALVQLELA